MGLNEEFIKKMNTCKWMSRCGEKDDFGFEVEYLDSKKKVKKSINGLKWENTCLDGREDFTEYMCINYKELTGIKWNRIAEEIFNDYVCPIIKQVSEMLADDENKDDIIKDMKFNIMSLYLLNYYSEYYKSEFLNRMEKIYLSGHLPCGWKGKYPKGTFIVY